MSEINWNGGNIMKEITVFRAREDHSNLFDGNFKDFINIMVGIYEEIPYCYRDSAHIQIAGVSTYDDDDAYTTITVTYDREHSEGEKAEIEAAMRKEQARQEAQDLRGIEILQDRIAKRREARKGE